MPQKHQNPESENPDRNTEGRKMFADIHITIVFRVNNWKLSLIVKSTLAAITSTYCS